MTKLRIGFDAKRAFLNGTGLGHYSRNLISSLAAFYPENEYLLFTPSITERFDSSIWNNVRAVTPESNIGKWFPSAWRSRWVTRDLRKEGIDLYHGLSHEIPFGLSQTGICSVVTIHDLIHERFPDQYNKADIMIYRQKFKYACVHADRVIAISQQTRQDIIDFYRISPTKIEVVYQCCHPQFNYSCTEVEIRSVREKYQLPIQYLLYVGSVIKRKNLLGICKALKILGSSFSVPLVVIGTGEKYRHLIRQYLTAEGMQDRVIWLSDNQGLSNRDFPAIYQGGQSLIYPSYFEGFGLPILEALWSRLPVITSQGSCFGETAGEAAIYVDPSRDQDIAEAIWQVNTDEGLRSRMKEEGLRQAMKFTQEAYVTNLMKVYLSITGNNERNK
ncbi:MAG TPA: glycosyltransferase family 1 protein [Chitinophagaceae bacterium]|nr:glycosyltransferase family 1 protein [Chitinophagaceae bacterium]